MNLKAIVIFTEPVQQECVCVVGQLSMAHQQLAPMSSRLPGAREANYEEKPADRDLNPRPTERAIALQIQQLGGSSLLIPHLQIEQSSINRGLA